MPPTDLSLHPASWQTVAEVQEQLYSPYVKEIVIAVKVPELANLVFQYLESSLSQNLINWRLALQNLKIDPETISPPPKNIHAMLAARCLLHSASSKEDGTPYTVDDKWLLFYDPGELINVLHAKNIPLLIESNSFQLLSFIGKKIQPGWFLITRDVLPESRLKTYTQLMQQIKDLNIKHRVEYEAPTFRRVIVANLLHGGARQLGICSDNTATYTREVTFEQCGKGPNKNPKKRVVSVGNSDNALIMHLHPHGSFEKGEANTGICAVLEFPN